MQSLLRLIDDFLQHPVLRLRPQPGQTVDSPGDEEDAADPQAIHRPLDDQTPPDPPVGGRRRPTGRRRTGSPRRTGQHLHNLHLGPRIPPRPVRSDQGTG